VPSNEQLDRDKKQLDADKQSRGSTITDLKRDFEELEKAKQSLDDDKLGFRSKSDGLDKTVSELQQRNNELETDVANGKSTLKTADDALATAGKEVQDTRSAKEVFKAQLAEAEDNHKFMEEITRKKRYPVKRAPGIQRRTRSSRPQLRIIESGLPG
jgi:chromosome segregation ATPase